MNLAELIVHTARATLAADPEILGLRLSPVSLTAAEAKDLAHLAAKELGSGAFIVVSAPGVEARLSGERVFVAPDQRAAEKATAWRNVVNVNRGEHLLYVSADEHDKAGGLRDCLIELTDDDLTKRLLAYYRDEGGVLGQTADALADAGLAERTSPPVLSEFLSAAAQAADGKKEKDAWAAVGDTLPLLGLAKDTRLARANASERLAQNRELVTRVATGEARRASKGQAAEIERDLRDAFRRGDPEALSSVDLAVLKLDKPKKGSKEKPKGTAKGAKTATGAKPPPPTSPKKGDKAPGSNAGPNGPGTDGGTGEGKPAAPAAPGSRWPAVAALPEGLQELLASLDAAAGSAIACRTRSISRRVLQQLPKDTEIAAVSMQWPERLESLIASLSQHRADVLARIDPSPLVATRVLIRAPYKVLKVAEVNEAVDSYLRRCSEFLSACEREPDAIMQAALARETICFEDASGAPMRVLGPLHPLWLAQVREAARTLADTTGNEFSILRRVLHVASPASWPLTDGSELTAAASAEALLVFERAPSIASERALESIGAKLARRFLDLSPHARVGLRVAILDGDSTALVEGLSKAVLDAGEEVLLRIVCDRPAALGTNAEVLLAAGRLSVDAVPSPVWEARPHIVFRLAPRPHLPEQDEPGIVTAANDHMGGLLKTHFVLDGSGLRACLDVTGVPALQAFERVHATLRRRRPTGMFTHDLRVTALSNALPTAGAPPTVWHVAVGPALGRRPPLDYKTLVYEQVDRSAVAAVISREIRPATRAVAEGLVRAGLTEDNEHPRALAALTGRLAAGSGGGILSLDLDTDRLIAAGLLGLELERRGAILIGRPEGSQYSGLVGHDATMDRAGALALAFARGPGDSVAITVGYATLDKDAEIKVTRGAMGGALADRVRSVLSVLRLSRERTPAGLAALEVLSWTMFPAIAANMERAQPFAEALSRWSESAEPSLSVLILAPPGAVGATNKSLEIDKIPVSLAQLNSDLFNRLVMTA